MAAHLKRLHPSRLRGPAASVFAATAGLLAIALSGPAAANSTAEGALQRGDFDAALGAAAAESGAEASFNAGLAHLALGNYAEASTALLEVAQRDTNPERALQAAVAVTLALSRSGERDAACEYASVIQPLAADLSLLWQGWIEQVRRQNRCA